MAVSNQVLETGKPRGVVPGRSELSLPSTSSNLAEKSLPANGAIRAGEDSLNGARLLPSHP